MSLFKKYKNDSKTQVMDLVDSSVTSVERMQKLHSELFPAAKLSDASSSFVGTATVSTNQAVARVVKITIDQVSEHNTLLDKVDLFITLHVPKIEDGGNFGVGVQLDLVKKLSEMKEKANKSIEELLEYEAKRASALEKLLPSSQTSVTKAATTTDGKKEEKHVEQTEEKSNASTGAAYESRVASVVAVDTLYYSKARGILSQTIISLVAVMDFIDKNKDKLTEPKGKSGGSNFSMY